MSTRSRIGFENPDGSVRSIYCHSDGYVTGVGAVLAEHYTDPAKIGQLLDLGDISSIGENIGEKHDFDWLSGYFGEGSEGKNYTEDPRFNMVKAYGRDRGETNVAAKVDPSADDMYRRACEGWEEFAYLFRDGQWLVTPVGGGAGPFMVKKNDPEGTAPPNWHPVAEALATETAAS